MNINKYRYIVIKSADAEAALSESELNRLAELIDKIADYRRHNGKEDRNYICISDKWEEEYSAMRRAIARRFADKEKSL